MGFIFRRLGFYALAAWVAVSINFFLPRLMPGDPTTVLFARFQGRLSPEAIAGLKAAFGLTDGPWWSQYATYLRHTLSGDLGVSVAYFPSPVSSVIANGLPWTVGLAGVALLISAAVGSLLGIASAWWRHTWVDSWVPQVFALLGSFPYFWLALVALYVFGFTLRWFPVGHAYRDDLSPELSATFVIDVMRHAALPLITMVLAATGGWLVTMRNSMISVLGSEYITLARARGLAPRTVVFRYAARNALLPTLTSFGMSLGFALGGALLTEIVFAYPGQGYLLVQAVRSQDYALMQGIFLVITIGVLLANFAADLLGYWLDPRARGGG